MADNEKPDFARQVREAYLRTETGDDDAPRRVLQRLHEVPPPRRTAWRLPALESGPQLGVALIAAGLLVLVGVGLVTLAKDTVRPRAGQSPAPTAGDLAMVRFELHAPGAGRVALVGDFNDWDPAATPMRRGGSADHWSVSLPVARGRHVYGFVVDRSRWLPDPAAPLAPEDGFGSPSSVIVVTGAGS